MKINKLLVSITACGLFMFSSLVMSEEKQVDKKNSKEGVSAEKKVNDSGRSQGVNNPGSEPIISPEEIEKRGRPIR